MRFQLALVAIAFSAASAAPLAGRDSIFDKTSVITSTKHINAPVEDVIATLHNFTAMITLNPLVTNFVEDPSDPTGNTFTITDSVPLILGLSFPTTYTAHFDTVDDGMDTNNTASAGVSLHNQWRAVANATGGTDLTETDTLTANFLLSGLITEELTTSHNQLMNTLASQLEVAAGNA
ncbi:hypothetical protein MSAN_02412000 [Mycena sanguinolenta]|uniref:DUF7053 domain-containing protein n=1 Tax=Mycena sanguinolenta TaxID=230812 RepID=A0A8H6X3Q7_9AGAR|nr:hypothetical protein MSAN_02412000 [Mycena sanguinolenta]